jgi:hypothetical protein
MAEQHERLVKRRLMGVKGGYVGTSRRIGAEHMVEGRDMRQTDLFRRLGEPADRRWVAADLILRKNDADLHWARLLVERKQFQRIFDQDFMACRRVGDQLRDHVYQLAGVALLADGVALRMRPVGAP